MTGNCLLCIMQSLPYTKQKFCIPITLMKYCGKHSSVYSQEIKSDNRIGEMEKDCLCLAKYFDGPFGYRKLTHRFFPEVKN